ncbi:DUF4365 domain-containing protein [Halobacillus locisalis]|uniref:DUF4365 domain-containing protein n=1 Tax=Halobacillus locisalis TaxID=220753 RepID=A0A838CTQ9_9BACI|nr:DUF4365 domain-containing protein [Halobacillus locisalis]MBA2175370.1 DUF4365 domain-containing protein [Halobacillus locisalis]
MSELNRIYGPSYEGNPKYTKTSMTDRAGVGIVMKSLAKSNLYFKELPTGDVGIDGIIEPVVGEWGTGMLIACQIKSSEGKFATIPSTKYINFNEGNLSHYKYWVNKSIPVIIILVDVANEICYWEHVTDKKISENEKSFSIHVPSSQVLNEDSANNLYEISLNRNEEESKYFYLKMNEPLIRDLERNKVQIRLIEKSLGEADIDLIIEDENLGTTYFKYDSDTKLIDALEQYFFWADLEHSLDDSNILLNLYPNEIGKKFIELQDELKKISLQFK